MPIRMTSKMKITDSDHGYRNMVNQLVEADGKRVLVGWFERSRIPGTNSSELRMAILNEFGKFDGDRAGNAPLRMMFDKNEDLFLKLLGADAYKRLLSGDKISVVLHDFADEAKRMLSKQVVEPGSVGRFPEEHGKDYGRSERILRALSDRVEAKIEDA